MTMKDETNTSNAKPNNKPLSSLTSIPKTNKCAAKAPVITTIAKRAPISEVRINNNNIAIINSAIPIPILP